MPTVPTLAKRFILKRHSIIKLKTLTKSRAIIFHASLVNANVEKFIWTGASNYVLSVVVKVLFRQSIWHFVLWFVFEILLI